MACRSPTNSRRINGYIKLRPRQAGRVPFIAYIAPFIPFLAMVPPSLAAMGIASQWFKSRSGSAELRVEIVTLRDEVAALRQAQAEAQERLDFNERMLSQLREARRDLPKASS